MKVSFGPTNVNAKNFSDKPISYTRNAVGILADGTLKELFSVIFCDTKTTSYATIFIRHGEFRRGAGKAGGYGYHKPSAALAEALNNAGINLSDDISGRGDGLIDRALEAIAKTMDDVKSFIIV